MKLVRNICPINTQVTFHIFLNEFIGFSESIWTFLKCFTVFIFSLSEFEKVNETLGILDMFFRQDSVSHSKIFRVIELYGWSFEFFSKTVFLKM